MIWTLRDFRRFWLSPAHLRWVAGFVLTNPAHEGKRAIGLPNGRDLTCFGDVR